MNYLLFILYFSVLLFVLYRLSQKPNNTLSFPFLALTFSLKVLSTFLFYFVYTRVYTDRCTADLFKYFDDAKILFHAWQSKPLDYAQIMLGLDFNTAYFNTHYYTHMNHWYREFEVTAYNDNRTMIRWNALFMLFSGENIHIHNLFSSFLSFSGLYYFYQAFVSKTKHPKIFAVGLFLSPSLIFWGSSMIKESLLLFLVGILWYLWEKTRQERSWRYLLFSLIVVFHLIFIKTYWIALIIPLAISYYVSQKDPTKSTWYFALCVGLLIGLSLLVNNRDYSIYYNMFQKQHDFIRLAQSQTTGSMINIEPLKDESMVSFIKAIPQALKLSIVLKWPWEKNSWIEWTHLLEGYGWIIISLWTLFYQISRRAWNKPIFWLCISLMISLFLLIGWTTPVVGAIVRYRILAIPFWALLLSIEQVPIFCTFEQLNILSWIQQKQPS